MAFDEMITLFIGFGWVGLILFIVGLVAFLLFGSTLTHLLITLFNFLVTLLMMPIKMFGGVLGKADKKMQQANSKMKKKLKFI